MADHVYRVVEIVGSSTEGTDAAVRNAISRANETVRNLEWFEVMGTRGHIESGSVAHFQVTVKIGFRVEAGDQV